MQALLAQRRLIDGAVDYRGQPVLAATDYIPSWDWGVVAKMDAAEAFAPVARLRAVLLPVCLATGLAVTALAVLLARTIVRPIRRLTRVAEKSRQGILTQYAEENRTDEIGILAGALNRMTAELLQTNGALEQRIRERTAALAESEARHRSILQALPDVYFLLEPDGTIVDYHAKHVSGLEVPPVALLGRRMQDVLPPEAGSRVMAAIQKTLETQELVTLEYALPVGGAERWYEARLLPVLARRIIAIARDVSESRHAYEALARTNEALRRSNEELEQFATLASHDLQEPLRQITNYTELLAKRYAGQLDARAEKCMHYIVNGAIRMQCLIHDLLAYVRVTRSVTREAVNVTEVLQQALATLAAVIAETGAAVTAEPLPAVWANPSQIRQVFQHLLGNALKFHGSAPLRVHVSVEAQPQHWVFGIHDNGIGLEPQYAERIFGVFERLHPSAAYPGTGIGLAICQKIVERHGGRIWVDSQPGQGATFYFTLLRTVHHTAR
jgi:PAS domain S-box-containing protein